MIVSISQKKYKIYNDGFSYLREKFQQGNEFQQGFSELDRIISFSMSCEGTSHLQSVNDILTGSFRYLANGDNPQARKALQKQIEEVMLKSSSGKFKEYGFLLRPKMQKNLPAGVKAEYQMLRSFLNSNNE
ncbi:hypothetical protein [Salipiger bermudensis]|uniref:hypothetical protein n=1 Tax=Salipiger bermudensis TaxID=344736 RepID=UPI0011853CD5|nr:hypothetical protein [Salipiger bermudensis]